MQIGIALNRTSFSKGLASSDFLSLFYGNLCQAAVQRYIVSMTYRNGMTVSGQHEGLHYSTVKYGLYLVSGRNGNVDAIVLKVCHIPVQRMTIAAEGRQYRACSRPWQLALVAFELVGKSLVRNQFACIFLGLFLLAVAQFFRLFAKLVKFCVEAFDLCPLGIGLLLIFL